MIGVSQSRDISTHPNIDWGLCYVLKQYREIRYWSWQVWSGIIVTYDRTQYAIDRYQNEWLHHMEEQINDRNRGQRGRHQDREWNYISMRKLQRQPFPKIYEILRTTVIQFNWKLPACVFSSTIQQPFGFQRGEKRKRSSSRSPPQPPSMCVCGGGRWVVW